MSPARTNRPPSLFSPQPSLETRSKSSPLSHLHNSRGMLGKSMPSLVFTINHPIPVGCSTHDPIAAAVAPAISFVNFDAVYGIQVKIRPSSRKWRSGLSSQIWKLYSSGQTAETTTASDEEAAWEACRAALSVFDFSIEEQDKILGKAFGQIHSPYWSEEREAVVPRQEAVCSILEYLRSLSLTDDDLTKLLKKFPEVLGCSLEDEVKNNARILEKDWGIEGKSLKNLLLRNPKVLGYNVDCKGDCMAQCTRCWVRF
ncbi:hypothetical protein Droror1_Dr00027860 [Drosera rotundifolia]